jgi:hypothetical protein
VRSDDNSRRAVATVAMSRSVRAHTQPTPPGADCPTTSNTLCGAADRVLLLSGGEAGRRHPGAIGPRAVAEDVCSRGIAIAAFVEDRQKLKTIYSFT